MKAGVSTACLYPKLLEDSLIALLEKGIKTTELFVNTHSELAPQYISEIKKTVDDYGAEITSLHSYTCPMETVLFFSTYERRTLDALDYYKNYFEAMNILGSKIFVFHGHSNRIPCPEERYFEGYHRLWELGKSFGVTVAQENVSHCISGSLDFLRKMSRTLGDDVRFVLDTKQAIRAGSNADAMYRALRQKIVHIHISDSGRQGDCLPMGEGNYNYERFFKILRENNYDGAIILELYRWNFKGVPELINSCNIIKDLIINSQNIERK